MSLQQDPYLWIRMVPVEDQDLVRNQAAAILSGKEAPPVEHRIVRKDGGVAVGAQHLGGAL